MTCGNTLTLEPASPIPRMTRETEVEYVYTELVLRCERSGVPPPALSEVMGMPEMTSIWESSPSSPSSEGSPPPSPSPAPSPRRNKLRGITGTCIMSDSLKKTGFQFDGVFIMGALCLTFSEAMALSLLYIYPSLSLGQCGGEGRVASAAVGGNQIH
jgi:hypothetical protein